MNCYFFFPFFLRDFFNLRHEVWSPATTPLTGTVRHRRDISVVLDGWWARGAASARPSCSSGASPATLHSPASGSSRRSRQMRAARQLRTPTNAQPKLTAPLAEARPERRRTCAVPTNVATWRLHCQSGHRPRPRRPPSGSAGRALNSLYLKLNVGWEMAEKGHNAPN